MYLRNSHTVAATLLIAISPATASRPCTQFSPSPVPVQHLSAYFLPQYGLHATALLDIEAIRHTLALYPYIIDGRDFPSLSSVFTADAIANYSVPIGVVNGLSAIESTLGAALASFLGTQHLLGSQSVRICDRNSAISVSYYRAVHFLPQNKTTGPGDVVTGDAVLYAYGQYQDSWEKRHGRWKINYRNLVYMVGDAWDPVS
ncbi:hypothetical protein SLS60_007779 [Paraconiothyrium brasiliense]|uniref:SnoaL-like domain-containing protein n=1 Tax=Paraconiothyrium brasiliense TaxID=300254 RepID=A0ABR3R2H6_9PLEO